MLIVTFPEHPQCKVVLQVALRLWFPQRRSLSIHVVRIILYVFADDVTLIVVAIHL